MRLSTSLLVCLTALPFVAQGLGCGGDDPPTVPSSKKKGGSSGSAGAGGDTGTAGTTGAGAGGNDAAGAAGTTSAAGAAGVTGAGAAGASGAGAGAAGTTGAGAAGASGAGVGGAAAAGASGATAGGNGGGGGMIKPKGAGYVEIFAGKDGATTFKNDGKARFVKAPAEGATSPCTTTDLAGTGCKVDVCTALPTNEVAENGGSIDVQVATATGPVTKMKLVFSVPNSSYSVDETMYPLPKDAAIYAGGQQLSVLSTGFEAPGFATETTAPGVLTLTSPAPGNVGQPINVDTKADLPLTFSGTGNGSLEVRIEASKKDNPNAYTKLTCSFPAGSSGAKIPAAALAKLPLADAAQYNTGLSVLSVSSAPVDNLQTYAIVIRATTHVLDGTGKPYGPQQVTLK